jgi:hypothetical protein
MFPDLKGELHIYFYELTEKIGLMDGHDMNQEDEKE